MNKKYKFDMRFSDIDNHPLYIEKINMDEDSEKKIRSYSLRKRQMRDNSWVRKRKYKKKMVRKFLIIDPDMDYSKELGGWPHYSIYCDFYDEGYYNARRNYWFNPLNKIYLSWRGNLKIYYGYVFPSRMSFACGRKNRDVSKITNRRIRHLIPDDECSKNYNYLKKKYGPYIDRIW